MTTREQAQALDAADPLAPLRELFQIPPGVLYLDGNSLGVLPKATPARVQQVVTEEWGRGLIGSWNSAGWMDLPRRVGDKVARLVGAGAGELVCADSTSVNLFKVLSAALNVARADAPQRTRIVSERSNFPTDLYIAEALARERGFELVLAEAEELPGLLDTRCAVLMQEIVSLPQIVIAAIPDPLHHDVIMTALRHDQHVIAVKPLVLRMDHAAEIERDSDKMGPPA